MLSRTASSLYWLGRYVERADFTARLVEATVRLDALSARPAGEAAWQSALAVSETDEAFAATGQSVTQAHVARFLTLDTSHPGSIMRCLDMARMNAKAVRTALTRDAWTSINRAWLLFSTRSSPGGTAATIGLVEAVKVETLGFEGAMNRMLRNQANGFIRLGQAIERADNTARLLDVKHHLLAPTVDGTVDYMQWQAVLRSVSALRAYQYMYRDRLDPRRIAELMILRPELPRSLVACLGEVAETLEGIAAGQGGRRGECHRLAGEIQAKLRFGRIDAILEEGLHAFLTAMIARTAALGEEIERFYIRH